MTGDESTTALSRMLDGMCDEDITELRAICEALTTHDAELRSAARFFADYREAD